MEFVISTTLLCLLVILAVTQRIWPPRVDFSQQQVLKDLQQQIGRLEIANSQLRTETAQQAATQRQELMSQFAVLAQVQREQNSALGQQLSNQLHVFDQRQVAIQGDLNIRSDVLRNTVDEKLTKVQDDSRIGREETGQTLDRFRTELSEQLKSLSQTNEQKLAKLQDDGRLGREETGQILSRFRTELTEQLKSLSQTNEQKLEAVRATVQQQLTNLQSDNGKKLDEMRATVDEKLHATLEKRLGESFKLVSDRLEEVHKGLGEMQTLASGVGDLKRVLTNVKTRGSWGEVQLGALLEQILAPEQYKANVVTKPNSKELVEYAIKLPGRFDDGQVWLPIDAKFPLEDYQRLIEAQERADLVAAEASSKQLENRLKAEARTIREKYIEPPYTTDFAILYLPTESLYAEVLRRPGLAESLQLEHRITLAGPTTLAAMLNSLQMGFKTLAIEKRSSEVWQVLGAVKTEFGKFGDVLARTKKKLQETVKTIDDAETRTRQITRKLKGVEALPIEGTVALLGAGAELEEEPDEASQSDMDR